MKGGRQSVVYWDDNNPLYVMFVLPRSIGPHLPVIGGLIDRPGVTSTFLCIYRRVAIESHAHIRQDI